MKRIPFITHLPLHLTIIKRAGTALATSSIIKSGQKDTEVSINQSFTDYFVFTKKQNTPTMCLILQQFNLYVLLICGKKFVTIKIFLLKFFGGGGGVKMAISAYILKIVEKDPFLRLQMGATEDFNRHQLFSHK